MIGDLYINGKDAWTEWGVNMGKNFLDTIDGFAPMKNYIENESRLEDGKRVLVVNPRVASRDLTLQFTIKGSSETDFRQKRKLFEEELRKGSVEVSIPQLGEEIYRLIYTGKNISYGLNQARNFCTFSAKFEEPNPTDRAPKS